MYVCVVVREGCGGVVVSSSLFSTRVLFDVGKVFDDFLREGFFERKRFRATR